jgi:hypothetical protein
MGRSIKVITQINDVVYRIQQHPTVKMIAVHLNRPAPYLELLRTSSLKEGAMLLVVLKFP